MVYLDSDALNRELDHGTVRPIYALLGPEAYLLERAIRRVRERAVNADTLVFNYAEVSCRTGTPQEILLAARTLPVLSERRMVLVQELELLPAAGQETLVTYLADPEPRTVLVLTGEGLDRRSRFFKSLKEQACLVEFPELKGGALTRWAESEIRRRGYRISPEQLSKLIDSAPSDLRGLGSEIDKLVLYCGGRKTVPEEAVDALIRSARHHSIFELTNALQARDRARALTILARLIEAGEPIQVILVMMARHYRQVLIAQEMLRGNGSAAEIGAAVQIPAYYLEGFLRQARALRADQARAMLLRLVEADRRFKSSGANQRGVLERIICSA